MGSLAGVFEPSFTLLMPPSGLSSLLNNLRRTLVTLFTLVNDPPILLGVELPLNVLSRLLTLLALLDILPPLAIKCIPETASSVASLLNFCWYSGAKSSILTLDG